MYLLKLLAGEARVGRDVSGWRVWRRREASSIRSRVGLFSFQPSALQLLVIPAHCCFSEKHVAPGALWPTSLAHMTTQWMGVGVEKRGVTVS